MKLVIAASQFLLGLSLIVGLHELGHLLFAKMFGMRVEHYAIGFPPYIFRLRWRGTTYALGSLPLGGAVKISGMVDEALANVQLSTSPQSWEFRAKPPWQRLIVILGGIVFNIVTGTFIYVVLVFSLGSTYLPMREVNKHGILPNELGLALGFREGDRIVRIEEDTLEKFSDIFNPATLLTRSHYTVLREGKSVPIAIPTAFVEKLSRMPEEARFVVPRIPFVVQSVQPHSHAAQAGLCEGDKLLSMAGVETRYLHQLHKVLTGNIEKLVRLRYERKGRCRTTSIRVSAQGELGIQVLPLLTYAHQRHSLWQATVLGIKRVFEVFNVNMITLRKLFSGTLSPVKSLNGPIGIAQVFGSSFRMVHFWEVVSFLSLSLAFANLLPIPALDGGHAVFLLYEMVTRRKLSDKFLMTMQRLGTNILLFLLALAMLSDLSRLG